MASATMRENSISRKRTESHTGNPRTPLIGLRDYVQERYPQHYRMSCDYEIDGRTIYRTKRFNGAVVDNRPIGELPDGMIAANIIFEDFRGTVIGEPEAITRIAKLEREFWSISNEIASLFCGEGVLA